MIYKMSFYYGSTTPVNNTLTNRNTLLNVLNTDPILGVYDAIGVTSEDGGYTVVIEFNTNIWAAPYEEIFVIDKMISIIFDGDVADGYVLRTVSTISDVPDETFDIKYNFNVGSKWLVKADKQIYTCYDNTLNNASWIPSLPLGITGGSGVGITGDATPFEGSILQYDDTGKLWIPQPGKWSSIEIPGTSMLKTGLLGATISTLLGSLSIYIFGATVDTDLYFNAILPHDYAEGTDIIPIINYIPTTSGTGDVEWALEFTWSNQGDTFGSPTTVTKTAAVSGTANNYDQSDFAPISGTGKKISSVLICRLYRNGLNVNDTYASNVGLISMELKYQKAGTGSTQMLTK